MRQYITKEEWNKLSEENKELLQDKLLGKGIRMQPYFMMSIGQIWEILEDKVECIFAQSEKGTWVVDIKDRASLPKQFEDKEPIVALWKAYKFTLTI